MNYYGELIRKIEDIRDHSRKRYELIKQNRDLAKRRNKLVEKSLRWDIIRTGLTLTVVGVGFLEFFKNNQKLVYAGYIIIIISIAMIIFGFLSEI